MTGAIWVAWCMAKAVWAAARNRQTQTDGGLAGKCLLYNKSYVLPQQAQNDRLIVAKMTKRVLATLWKSQLSYTQSKTGAPHTAIFCGTTHSESDRRTYITQMTGQDAHICLFRQTAHGGIGLGDRLILTLIIFSYFPLLFLLGVFSTQRANWALLLQEFVDAHHILQTLRQHQIRKLYCFNIFDIDTNFITWCAMQRGIEVTKIASDVPLGFLNKTILGDQLATCIQYQAEEAKYFPEIKVKEVVNWLPEHSFKYVGNYTLPKQYETPRQTLGFYSSGSWRRKEMGHSDPGAALAEGELALCQWIKDYAMTHPETEIKVFPHPLEKKTEEIYQRTQSHYQKLFGEIPVKIMPRESATTLTFDQVDLAISLFSTVSYERLFMGFKSLFFIYQDNDFPIPGSNFERICVKPNAQFHERVHESLQQSRREFFDQNGLMGYSIEDFKPNFAGENVRNSSIL